MNIEKVDILMACYNGEKYLRNQILSLQQQTHNNWHLYIRDDGSTDNTLEIIQEFLKDPRVTLIKDNKKSLGCAKNFKELFKYSTADYVICCDQDDIWFEKKIEILYKYAVEKFKESIPCLVYCDGYGYLSDTGQINIFSISKLHAKKINEFLFFNAGYQGCSILMNKKLAGMFNLYCKDFFMHDNIISLIAHTFGEVYFLPKKLMLYRQHSRNVTGNIKESSLIKKAIFDNHPLVSKEHFKEKKCFFEYYQESMDLKVKRYFEIYFDIVTVNNFFYSIYLVRKYGFKFGQFRYRLYFKIIFRPMLKR